MKKLQDLYSEHGQSPWLDNLRRDWLHDGTVETWRDKGIRGVTSNPTIFGKAMASGDAYDEQFSSLAQAGTSVMDSYWAMVVRDIADALALFRPLYDESGGGDGFVSLEVAPSMAHDTAATVEAAQGFFAQLDAPNLLVKIPATVEGVPAIQTMVSEGRSINVTLIFSIERYAEVIEAYIAGLEAYARTDGADLSQVRGVASFFVSRVDTEIDKRLEKIGSEEAMALRGRAAVAQAKLAYRLFQEQFSGPRWEALAAEGANPQRPLWASTGTKNPAYSNTLYVDSLIGPDSVNTMPDATLEAFEADGTVARTVDVGVDEAEALFSALDSLGLDVQDVGHVLEDEGVASFAKSFDDLIETLEKKAAELS